MQSTDMDQDTSWSDDMTRLPANDDATPVVEVRMRGKSGAREILETILLTLGIFLAVQALVQNFKVEGESMLPSLVDGQYLWVDKVSFWRVDDNFVAHLQDPKTPAALHYAFGNGPQRGDIIVLHAWHEDKDYIKRVIGLPGETIEIKSYDGVYINGKLLVEPYIKDKPDYTIAPTAVPPDSVYVLGDNRRNSSDSHVSVNGPASFDQIVGRAVLSYWPFATFGPLAHPSYDLGPTP